jgi:hypothetical protein
MTKRTDAQIVSVRAAKTPHEKINLEAPLPLLETIVLHEKSKKKIKTQTNQKMNHQEKTLTQKK